jgi:predicted acetyltransferase
MRASSGDRPLGSVRSLFSAMLMTLTVSMPLPIARALSCHMPRLIKPAIGLHTAWVEGHLEWGAGLHEDGFGILPSDEVVSSTGFTSWLDRLSLEESGADKGDSNYRCVYRWIIDDGTVVGGIAVRYGDDDFVNTAGHIGYGIRPSARGRGLATWALGQMLSVSRDLKLERVLLVCEADNTASAATIERNAGDLEQVVETDDGPMRRYRITL